MTRMFFSVITVAIALRCVDAVAFKPNAKTPVSKASNPSSTTPQPAVTPSDDDAATTKSPFRPWPEPMVVCRGDYREETYLEEHIGGPLYSKQDELPRLPVPDLQDTIDLFLPSALPLIENDNEKDTLLEACKVFPKEAKILQERLIQRRDENPNSSWLQHWWNTMGYLQYRDPVTVYVSYFLWMPDDKKLPKDIEPNIARAAAALVSLAQSRKAICSGEMSPESIPRKDGQDDYFCSTGFKYVFHSCRIPQSDGHDTYHIYDPSLHKHCVIACRGQFYTFDFVNDNGEPLPLKLLEQRLQYCVEQSEKQQDWPELGWLTSSDRDSWAEAREKLLDRGGDTMKSALATLESAAFIINLDMEEPENLTETGKLFWHGGDVNGGNRWFDKACELLCTKDGRVAYLGEHSMLDAAPAVPLINRMLKSGYSRLIKKEDPNVKLDSKPEDDVSNVFEECWSSEEFKNIASDLAAEGKARHTKLTNDYDIEVINFDNFGKKYVKNAGYDAFGFVQMALQLASYRLFGKQVGTYEAGLTRYFLHGRTETVRSVSTDSQAFVESMGQGRSDDPAIRKEQRELLQKAIENHDEYQQRATKGLGVDRHFFGLSCLVEDGEEAPKLFSHPTFQRSKSWRLSTSAVTYAPGFGPVVNDGIGIGYGVGSDSFLFTCTSRKENDYIQKFTKLLNEALDDMGDLVKKDEE